jgi:O-antigen ligase
MSNETFTNNLNTENNVNAVTRISSKPFGQKFLLIVLAIIQGFLALTVATGALPPAYAWLQLLVVAVGAICLDEYNALLLVIVGLPFYLALPNARFDSLSAWRVAVIIVFIAWLIRVKAWRKPFLTKRFWLDLFAGLPKWDKYLLIYAVAAAITIAFEPFRGVGLFKLMFFANAYGLYLLILAVASGPQKIKGLLTAFFASSATIVIIGYIQYAATFFSSTYNFWQYWATVISRNYYGSALSNSLVYSNSWFSFNAGGSSTLRMFSILPDSHAFALVAMISCVPALALLVWSKSKTKKVFYWIYIFFASAAIELSGTRGAWAGALVPLVVGLYLLYGYRKQEQTDLASESTSARQSQSNGYKGQSKIIWRSLTIILLLGIIILLSPFVQKGVSLLDRNYNSGNDLLRAESIYDLQETSNAGRIAIWKHTLAFDLRHPIVGSGLGNFVITLVPGTSDYNAAANQNQKAFNLPARYVTAHDLYLDVLTETGLLGLIPFILYLFYIGKSLWLSARRTNSQYLMASLLMFFWILGYSFFDGTLINDRVLLYFLIMVGIAAATIKEYKHA